MELAIFNAPMFAQKAQQPLGWSLLGRKAGRAESHFVGFFDDQRFAYTLDMAFNTNELGCTGQTKSLGLEG